MLPLGLNRALDSVIAGLHRQADWLLREDRLHLISDRPRPPAAVFDRILTGCHAVVGPGAGAVALARLRA